MLDNTRSKTNRAVGDQVSRLGEFIALREIADANIPL
jgi:hypothetical protein